MTKKNQIHADSVLGERLLSLLSGVEQVEFENFKMEIGDLELFIPVGIGGVPGIVLPEEPKRPTELFREGFSPAVESYPGSIREVTLGATKKDGGSRGSTITIGGSTTPAFSNPALPPKNRTAISMDVFDMAVALPKTLKAAVLDVMDDPAEWARMNVNTFGADCVTVHLMSTDPLIQDRSPQQAANIVEEMLQAVDVPLIIGGCGDPKKDAAVFTEVAERAAGERLLLNSVTLDMAEAKTLEGVAKAAHDNGHLLLAFTGLELNSAKELNRRLYEYLPPEEIVMDLTTVALGYGLEYSFTIHERARHAALMGDTELQHPTISASTNAWAAREAWMTMEPEYSPKEIRGPIWETVNSLTLLLAGVDIFMMMHPSAVRTMQDVRTWMMQQEITVPQAPDWVRTRC